MQLTSLWKICMTLCGTTLCLGTTAWSAGLSENLANIEKQYRDGADMKQVETQCIGLLKTYTSPEDQGKIYAEIPALYLTAYSGTKQSQRDALPADAVIEYSKKALALPIDPELTAKMYYSWGHLEETKVNPDVDPKGYAAVRRQAIGPYLKGLKFLFDKNLPENRPSVDSLNTRLSGISTRESRNERGASLHQTINLAAWRDMIAASVEGLYGYPGDDISELTGQITAVIGQTKQTDKIIASVQEKIDRQLQQ